MGVLAAFLVAVLMAFVLAGYKRKDSVMPLIILFLVLFFAGIAAQYWIVPIGPVVWGIRWVPLIITIVIVGLLFSSPPPHRKPGSFKDTPPDPGSTVISILIWSLLLIFIIVILLGIYHVA